MSKTSNFQIVLRVIFGVFIVVAVLIFSGVLPGFKNAPEGVGGQVVLWGSVDDVLVKPIIDMFNTKNGDLLTLVYEEKSAATFENDLLEALASGTGPDLFLLSQSAILKQKEKVFPIPEEYFSRRDFTDMYIDEAQLCLDESGVLAVPLLLDPLMMYWNKDLFSSAGIAKPFAYWDEFILGAQDLTESDSDKNISQSMVALGEFGNIAHAKDILSMMILQTGNEITAVDKNGNLKAVFNEQLPGFTSLPAETVLRFYTEFSNPAKPSYSWNRSMQNSKKAFLAEELALYFGYASELSDISVRNPHLNFDVTTVPQIRDLNTRATYGDMLTVAIARNSQNIATAIQAAILLTDSEIVRELSNALAIPPAKRDLLAEKQTDIYRAVFFDSAIISRSWLDPNPQESMRIFKDMIESITSGRMRISEAVASAQVQIDKLR